MPSLADPSESLSIKPHFIFTTLLPFLPSHVKRAHSPRQREPGRDDDAPRQTRSTTGPCDRGSRVAPSQKSRPIVSGGLVAPRRSRERLFSTCIDLASVISLCGLPCEFREFLQLVGLGKGKNEILAIPRVYICIYILRFSYRIAPLSEPYARGLL